MAESIVSILLKVKDQASAPIKGLKSNLDKLNNSTLGKTIEGLTGFNLASVTAAGAVVGLTKFLGESVKDWSAYAEQMDKSAKLSGVSAEEMSRLTQAADDFRVSQEALKTAMGMALKNGFTPTIDNLAKLSDEFIAIKDPADRAALASGIFGRGWQEIAPLLLKGGDAIRSGTAAIADNLVVTDEAVKQNQEYIKAMDDLQDAWTGIKNTAAQGLIPALTNVLQALNGEEVNRAVNGYERMFKSVEDNLVTFEDVGLDVNEMLKNQAAAAGEATPPMDFLADATNNADAAMRKYSEALLFSIASEGLSEEAALALAQRMGLVDEKTVLATEKTAGYKKMLDDGKISLDEYNILVSGLADSLDRLEDKTVTVTYNQVTTGTAPNGYWQGTGGDGSTVTAEANGGPVYTGNAYLWNESPVTRPETFVASQNGYILTKQDAQAALSGAAGGRGGGDTIINVYGAEDPQRTANLVGMSLRAASAMQGA